MRLSRAWSFVSRDAAAMFRGVNSKTEKIAALAAPFAGQREDARYLAWFDCFNRQLYFEAHEVLEELWLPIRRQPAGDFYKGLIQLAGAFVHLQKARPGPAAALFRLADANLAKFADGHRGFQVADTRRRIVGWLRGLANEPVPINPLHATTVPRLELRPGTAGHWPG
jgi:hypothetical protein